MQIRRTFSRPFSMALIFSCIFGLFTVLQARPAQAQNEPQMRLNDKDMEALMRNLRDDAKSFRPEFDSAVHKSTIRKTSQEKLARDQSASFESETNTLLDRFKHTRNGQGEFSRVMDTARQIDITVHSLTLGEKVTNHWEKIRTELHQIAEAYGVPGQLGRSDTDAMDNDNAGSSCLQQAGAVKANRLVNECLQVSPATHPPCNAQNSCSLIISEIKRSCAMLGQGAPGFCGEYR